MARNMIVRLGIDASDFQKKMQQAGASAESVGKRIKKSMSMEGLGSEVARIMGWGGTATGVGSINAGNIDVARSQLGTLRSYRDQLAGAGFDDYQFGLVSERIKELEYDLNEYAQSLRRTADAEQETAREADNLGDEARKTEIPVSKASRTLREMGNSGRRLSIIPGFLRRIRDSAGGSNVSLEKMVRTIRNVSVVSFGLRIVRGLFGELSTIVRNYISQDAALQAQVNGLSASLGNSLAPAIRLVTNAMSYVLPYVVGVSNAIGQLMGALFGTGWSAGASGANKMAAATGGAAKAQKELNRQLLSFDQINRMESQKDTGSGGGGGGGAAITPIEAKTPAWMERFKKSFSDLFNSEEFKGANIGGKIGMAIQTGIEWLSGEAGNFDWSGLSVKIRQNFNSMIEAIDWSGALQLLGKGIGFVLGTGAGLIADLFRQPWKKFSEQLKNDMQLFGGDAVAGFFFGIGRGIANIGIWLWDNLIKPIIDGVKAGFGIHSPSTVFAEIGENCMAGLASGFANGMQWILQKLDDLRDRVSSAAETLKNAFSFQWSLPHLRLPHLQVNWDPVDNVLAQFFGVTAFPRLSVQWFARGGILDGAQIFGRMGSTLLGGGERGREAILPLDTNTGWMDVLANRIAQSLNVDNSSGDIVVNVLLDGDLVTSYVLKKLRNKSRAGTSSF